MLKIKTKILLVDDEPQIRRFLRASLSAEEFDLTESISGEEAIRLTATNNPDIVLLDLGLPDIDGIEVAKRIREWSDVPIIVLSARGQESDKVTALDSGADDYLTKPFSMGELHARIRVAIRRRQKKLSGEGKALIKTGLLEIDLSSRLVKRGDKEIHLTPTEYQLLSLLAQNAGRVLTQKYLLTKVWGAAYARQGHYLRVFMGQLRHKLEEDPSKPDYILTEPGVGYRFKTLET